MKKEFCKDCIFAQEELVVGNGITEPEFLKFIICPFENDNYKHPNDECDYIDETNELATILRNQ